MSDITDPGEKFAPARGAAIGNWREKHGGGAWIVDGVDIANIYTALDTSNVNGFNHASTSGLDVTFDGGEAYVGGWICRDTDTTVTLPASATTTIYVGYDASAILADGQAPADSQNIIIGPAGDFANEDPRTPIYEFTTDSTTVISSETQDLRKLTQPIEYDPATDTVSVPGDVSIDGGVSIGGAASVGGGLDVGGDLAVSGIFELVGRRVYYDTGLTGDSWLFQRDSATAETALAFLGTNVGLYQTPVPSYPVHMGGNANIDGTLEFNGGSEAAVREGDGVHRDIYVSDTEPSAWTDGDIWMEPQ